MLNLCIQWGKEIRLFHLTKSFFLFLPLIFGGQFFCIKKISICTVAALLFYLLSVAIYIFNDIVDRKEDCLRPDRCHRPIASGKISVKQASIVSIILSLFVFSCSYYFCPIGLTGILLTYWVLNIYYSLFSKKCFPLDIFILATGFLLRTVAGAYVTNIPASKWLLTIVFLLALLLAAGKRANQTLVKQEFIQAGLMFIGTSIFVLYTVYVFDTRHHVINSDFVWLTIFPVLFGLLSYLKIIFTQQKNYDPVYLLLHEQSLQYSCFLFLFLVFIFIYVPNDILKGWFSFIL